MSTIGVGETGTLGQEWQIQNNRRNKVARMYGTDGKLDLSSSMSLVGADKDASLDRIEYGILGDRDAGGTLLDWQASAWSAGNCDDRLFQSGSGELYTNVDLEKGTYKVMDEQTLTEELGMDWSGGKPYDVLEISNNRINFYDFVFCGEEDGDQENLTFQLNELTDARWGLNSYVLREVDTDLLKSAVYNDSSSDYQQALARNTLEIMMDSLPAWATDEIKEALDGLVPESDEYYEKFIEYAIQIMDNEGYEQGNTIDSPTADDQASTQTKKTPDKNGLKVVRGENGQVRVTLNNVEGFNITGAGAITGSGTFSIGETSDAQTVVQAGQIRNGGKLDMNVSSDLTNLEFYGDNVNANFNSSVSKSYNVQWNASNGTLNSTKGAGSMYINTSEDATNNTFKVGDAKTKVEGGYDNVLIDNGKNNVYKADADTTNLFITSETSEGALIYGGDGENTALIGGKNGIYVGGSGNDHIITDANSKNNLLFGMDGDDTIDEYGQHNTFLGGKGYDYYNSYGKNNLANLGYGEDYELNFNAGSDNKIFTGEELEDYNYNDYINNYLAENGITISELLNRLNMTASEATVEKIVAALTGNVLDSDEAAKKKVEQIIKQNNSVNPSQENDDAQKTTKPLDEKAGFTIVAPNIPNTVKPDIPRGSTYTTMALGEEGGDTTAILDDMDTIVTPNIPKGSTNTTMALGEEGGGNTLPNGNVTELENNSFIDFTDKLEFNKKYYTQALNENGGKVL